MSDVQFIESQTPLLLFSETESVVLKILPATSPSNVTSVTTELNEKPANSEGSGKLKDRELEGKKGEKEKEKEENL